MAWAGPAYDPGIGFSQRNDFTLLDDSLAYARVPGEASPLISHTLGLSGFAYLRNRDGSLEAAEVGPEWEFAAKSGAGGSVEAKALFEDLLAPARDQRLDARLARLRVGTALNTRVSTNAFIQLNSATHSLSADVRFRYHLREGDDLWVVYNEGLNTDRHRVAPTLPLTDNRTVLVKYTYTFSR